MGAIENLEAFDNGMASGAKRNHQRGLRGAGDAMMDDGTPLTVTRLPQRRRSRNLTALKVEYTGLPADVAPTVARFLVFGLS